MDSKHIVPTIKVFYLLYLKKKKEQFLEIFFAEQFSFTTWLIHQLLINHTHKVSHVNVCVLCIRKVFEDKVPAVLRITFHVITLFI